MLKSRFGQNLESGSDKELDSTPLDSHLKGKLSLDKIYLKKQKSFNKANKEKKIYPKQENAFLLWLIIIIKMLCFKS